MDNFDTLKAQKDAIVAENKARLLAPLAAENEQLRARLESAEKKIAELIEERDGLEEVADNMAAAVLGESIDWPFHDAKWREATELATEHHLEVYMRRHSPLIEERDQLRARVAAMKDEKMRLVELLKVAKCPDERCDGKGSSWDVACTYAGEPEQVQVQCQWCYERQDAINATQNPQIV